MNKMHFYCFLPSLSTDFTDFTDFFCHYHRTNQMNQMAGAMCGLVKSGASGVFFIINGFN